MQRPVSGEVHVDYGQIYVESDPDGSELGLSEAFGGQSSGLCGAAVQGALWLQTGLHTGHVGFSVEVHRQAPPLDPVWEDVVEVSFRPASTGAALVEWGGGGAWDLGLQEIDYRVRYCARGMDEARRHDVRMDEAPQVDCYLLQFWPAEPAPDRVLKQTSTTAAYWHGYAREQPAPPTPAERAEAERRARLAQERAKEELRLAYERWEWGGQLPSQALREVGGNVRGLRSFDPGLVHCIDVAGPRTQRAISLLAARRACEAAGLDQLEWVAAGLAALEEGRPLPPPLDDPGRVWRVLAADPQLPQRTVGQAVPPERPPFQPPPRHATGMSRPEPASAPRIIGPAAAGVKPASPPAATMPRSDGVGLAVTITLGAPDPDLRMSQPHMALPALLAAGVADPLQAALDAVHAAVAAYGEDYRTVLEEVRSLCRKE
nr:hypothetical protein [Streptomyces sp. S10(2018)]